MCGGLLAVRHRRELFEGDDFRRTQLVRDSVEVEVLSEKWQKALLERGWTRE